VGPGHRGRREQPHPLTAALQRLAQALRPRRRGRVEPAALRGQAQAVVQQPRADLRYRDVLARQERSLGPDNRHALATRHNLALCLHVEGRHAEAWAEYEAVLGPSGHAGHAARARGTGTTPGRDPCRTQPRVSGSTTFDTPVRTPTSVPAG
jgi:hypothetical protein